MTATIIRDTRWDEHSACKGVPTDLFYPAKGGQSDVKRAKAYCDACPVTAECLTDELALGLDRQWGVRGGTTPEERRKIIRASRNSTTTPKE